MGNANLPAMPNSEFDRTGTVPAIKTTGGLTKREMFAMAAMQGLASSADEYSRFYEMATDAVAMADALLAELERAK